MRQAPIYDADFDPEDGQPGGDGRARPRPPGTRRWTFALGALLGLALATVPTVAQSPGPDPEEVARQNAVIVATLVRTTLVALHHANVTGNYTVLRDLAVPSFRDRNSAADLAAIFAPLRAEGVDLAAAVVLEPQLAAAPAIDEQGRLRIAGVFQMSPASIRFELMFQAEEPGWRLFGLSVNPIRPTADASSPNPRNGSEPPAQLATVPGSLVPPMPRPRPPAPTE